MLTYFTPAYVIKAWYASNLPNRDGNYIFIEGRQEGLISWLLSLLKIEPTFEIRVTANEVRFSEGSFQGRNETITPMRSISTTLWGFEKPIIKAVILFFILTPIFVSIVTMMHPVLALIGLVAGFAIAFVVYFLNKIFTVGFVANSGIQQSIRFKKSVIEGQEINEAQAEYVSQIMIYLIESKAAKDRS